MTTHNPATDCPTVDVLFSEGDQLPTLAGCLQMNLTGHTVQMDLQRPTDVLIKTAVLSDPEKGLFEFVWDVGDLQEGIGQIALLRLFNPSAESQSLARFKMDVQKVPA